MQMRDVEPKHILRLIEAVRAAGKLGQKTIANLYSVIKGAFERARFERLIQENPCKLPPKTIRYRSTAKRQPYTRREAFTLTTDKRIPIDSLTWNAMAFYTGMREGEVCGRRWRDWTRDAVPLSALRVHTQYNDQPLKTDEEDLLRPRSVPVHPELELILREWWSNGFELVHRRKPTLDDFIVPNRNGGHHTKSSAYKMFQRSLAAVGIENRTLHATRNTFISITRTKCQRLDLLESVTHNSKGATIDIYTSFEWRPLCDAVACFDLDVDQASALSVSACVDWYPKTPTNMAPAPGLEPGSTDSNQWEQSEVLRNPEKRAEAQNLLNKLEGDAVFDARQRKLASFWEADPDAARPGLAIYRGFEAAFRMTDDPDAEAEAFAALLDCADAMGGIVDDAPIVSDPGPTDRILAHASKGWVPRRELVGDGPDRNVLQVTLHRLHTAGLVERRGERNAYSYRAAPSAVRGQSTRPGSVHWVTVVRRKDRDVG